jgi:hypothetical protein
MNPHRRIVAIAFDLASGLAAFVNGQPITILNLQYRRCCRHSCVSGCERLPVAKDIPIGTLTPLPRTACGVVETLGMLQSPDLKLPA